ncbi:MAG TPA: bifunctional UDP-N-acetylmuramoyl-tripeptide:D-alanyl-D-alanine ligase/alanine racemase [Flavobacterium sp.]
MNLTIENIIPILSADFSGIHSNAVIDNISIDSRSLQNNEKTLFFALSGPNNDAHRFIPELISKGVSNFVVTTIPAEGNANFLCVENTLEALQNLASAHRKQFSFPIIGITGSNGKTIVKEWLNFLLSPDYNIIRSPKSYNSQVGVPLSVLGINERHNLGIFEAGISQPHEMQKLQGIIKPTIGILTNIGPAHDEGFASADEKIVEKLQLFANSDVVIYRKNAAVDQHLKNNKTYSWSVDDASADVDITIERTSVTTLLKVSNPLNFTAVIPFADDASIENAITCLMVMLYLKYNSETIRNRMHDLYPVEMRLKIKNGINNTTVIDDSYSSDFQSLRIALDFLESQKHHKKKTVILSDIFQSGLPVNELYKKVAELLSSNKIDRIIGIGKTISEHAAAFRSITTYASTQEFISTFNEHDFSGETILVKGARQFSFENIVTLLEEKTHETVLEINLNAISHNLNFFRTKLMPETKLMVMVKAFGYGNGGFEIAKLLEHHKTDYLGVAFADEGISLKNAGITLPIMVLNPETTSFASIIQHNLEPEIYSIKGLKAFIKTASDKNLADYPVHIKLDTGMHRLGFEQEQIPELIHIVKSNKSIRVASILSHMATSDDLKHHKFALEQIALFEKLSSQLMEQLRIKPIRHILNTSGISNYPQAQYDMVRLGIGLYGVSNDPDEQKYLENVGTLKSVISQLRTIDKGESVGYGRRFIAEETASVATIPIGYADGIPRSWGNNIGYVTINNKKAPIVGSVCMDMLMADCTGIDCREGDAVIIFGESPTVTEIAEKLNTISYEILTGISQRVKRIFFRE